MPHEFLKHLRKSLPSVARKVEHTVAKDLKIVGRGAVKAGKASYKVSKAVSKELQKDAPYVQKALLSTSVDALKAEEMLTKLKLLKYDTRIEAGEKLSKDEKQIYAKYKGKLKKIEYLKTLAENKKGQVARSIESAERMRAERAEDNLSDAVGM
jgi:hypothetical protein